MKYYPNVVRVGSGGDDDELKARRLNELFFQAIKSGKGSGKEYYITSQKLELVSGQIKEVLSDLQRLEMEDLSLFDIGMLLDNIDGVLM